MKQKIQKKRGFSLFELLIYIAILAVIVVVISNILISLSNNNAQSQVKSEVNSSIRFAGELLRQDIKGASLAVISEDKRTLTLTRNGVQIVYSIIDGILKRKEGVDVASNITSSNIVVDELIFTKIENTNQVFNTTNVSIKINMTFKYNSTVPSLTYSSSFENTVSLY